MSITAEILEKMWDAKFRYKGIPVNGFGIPFFWSNKKEPSKNLFNVTFSRMKKNGLIEIRDEKWFLTELGKKYFDQKGKLYIKFSSPFPINSPKNLLLIFDIPESKRSERNWLRWHLKEFQYYMIQQSVWVGPSPLPKKFLDHIKQMGIDSCIKTFKLAKPY